jgi:DNA-binding response OmpR family regulator
MCEIGFFPTIQWARLDRTIEGRNLFLAVSAPVPFLANIKIVALDDQPDSRLLIARFLARRGAQVFVAKNAFEGFRLIRIIRPDVVLSDINMPGRSGFDLLLDIRSLGRENGGDVPVIAMSAHWHEEDLTMGAGFQKYLPKPFTPDELLAAIDSVLRV